jgi:hypothetical protein
VNLYCLVTLPFSILINGFHYLPCMSILQLREYDACTFWLESLKTKSTLNAYTFHLSTFCKFHNTDPDELIQLSNSMAQLKTMILNYVIHLKKIAKQSAGKPRKEDILLVVVCNVNVSVKLSSCQHVPDYNKDFLSCSYYCLGASFSTLQSFIE